MGQDVSTNGFFGDDAAICNKRGEHMLISLASLLGYHIHATDGELGKIVDFYFDENKWTVRDFVVELGNWFDRGKVLLSPLCLKKIDSPQKRLDVSLNMEKVKNSPDIDAHKPFSRQVEADLLNYYQWPHYWTGAGIWGTTSTYLGDLGEAGAGVTSRLAAKGTHLRSLLEIIGYEIHTSEANFGKIEDAVVYDDTWELHYLVAKTKKWLPSKSVLLSPKSIKSISWQKGELQTSLSSKQIRRLPGHHHGEPFPLSNGPQS